jgi:hypothetical protein
MAKAKVSAAQAGFSKDLLSATGASALSAVSQVGADEQADLVEAWVANGNIEAVAAVAEHDDAPAPARKAARRGVNVLKARGIQVPAKTTVARPLAGKAETSLEARFTAPDGNGACVVAFLEKSPGRDTRVVEAVIDDRVGILRIGAGNLSSSKLRTWENTLRQRLGFVPVPVSLAWARARVAAARKVNATSGQLLPLELDANSEILALRAGDENEPHPALAFGKDITDAEIAERVPSSGTLHNEAEFAPFLPTRQALNEGLAKVGERLAASGKGTDITEDAVSPILLEEMAAATDRFFEPGIRELLAARMLDGALSIQQRRGDDRARDVLVAREAVLRAGLVTQPPRDIPFLRAFFDKAIAMSVQQNQGRLNIPMPAQQDAQTGLRLSSDQLAAVAAAKTDGVGSQPEAEG